jgi:hypothetical protein
MTTKKPDDSIVSEQGKELANYDEMLAAMAKKATAIEKPTTSNVGTRAGILTLNGDPAPGNKLDVIIIASTHANLYYEGEYDEKNPTNPVCYAYSEDGEDMAPHPKSQKPQNEDCASCPWNAWESDPKGGRGKACKNTRRLAMIPASTTVEDLPTAELATMQLPVTSVKVWAQYVNKLSTLFARPPLGVYTIIGSEPDRKTTFKLTFLNGPLVDVSMIMPLVQKAEGALEQLERVYEHNVELTEEQLAAKAELKGKSEARAKRF